MATNTPATSFEDAPSLAAWNSLSDEDQIRKIEEVTKILELSETETKFVQECQTAGRMAVAIDNGLRSVQRGFFQLAEKYGGDFPEVRDVYVPRWNGFKNRWSVSSGMLWSSRELASKTVSALNDFDENIEIVEGITDTRSLQDAQTVLKEYVDRHPIKIANTVADDFKNFSNEIQDFSKDFTQYLKDMEQKLSEEARAFTQKIESIQKNIKELDEQIKRAAIALSVTFCIFLFAAVPASFLAKYISERNTANDNLDKAKEGLGQTIRKQAALAALKAEFEQLKPTIDDICEKLGIFAHIWAFATMESIIINDALEGGIEATVPLKFKAKLKLLRKQVPILRKGMETYATYIK